MADTAREEFEAWWVEDQLKTLPDDYDLSRLERWGADYKPKAWEAWKRQQERIAELEAEAEGHHEAFGAVVEQKQALAARVAQFESTIQSQGGVIVAMRQERDAALAQVQARWQPIRTAPKDGTPIVLARDERVTCGHWEPERCPTAAEHHSTTGEYLGQFETGEVIEAWWYSEDGGFDEEHSPTHWMPLPPPPIDAAIAASKGAAS